MKKVLILTSIIVMIFATFAVADDVIKIGVALPMTGNISSFGQMVWQGVELANEMFPTVLGKKVELVLADNRSDKTEAANVISRLINLSNVVGILGEVASSNTMAGAPIAEKYHIPLLSPASTNPLVTQGKTYTSRVCFIDPFQGHVAAVFAINNLKAKTAAVFTDVAQDYSVGLSNFFIKDFTAAGGVVYKEYYQSGDQDFSAQLTDALSHNPDVIYISGYYPEIALMAKQARQLGYKGPFLAGDGAEAPELIKIAGSAVNGLYYTSHFNADHPVTKIGQEFVAKFEEKYHTSPSALAALGFDDYLVMLNAIERANSTDPVKINEAIRSTKNFEGATGYITIGSDGNAVKSAVINEVVNGQFTYVTTINP
ncbi:ABC transporter substrate-binding protein [Athalassotoga saccharophila]|uniref:ABC transporter substrate-binding protein n=1 Tax=Athalassotoga saccharophila TaxID=1441386 RepID=UPI00137ADAB1|nr:ABC transporter substrate-binding protein [Athalassotoga saccharophila]BBJ27351.1 branched-chain amino acid ABC transporter, amino acid-binding protein [Athalassotoga saccharophila]